MKWDVKATADVERSGDDIHWRQSVRDPCKDVMRLNAGCGAESTPLAPLGWRGESQKSTSRRRRGSETDPPATTLSGFPS